MKIGIEAQRIFRPKKHGMDIVALEMIRQLQLIDLENEYFIFVKKDIDVCLEETSNFKIIEITSSNYALWEQVILPQVTNKYHLDILHCTSNTAPIGINAKLVLTLHDIIYMEKSNTLSQYKSWYQKLGKIYRKWNVPLIVNKAKAIITVSDFEKDRIKSFFQIADNKIHTVYNGVADKFNASYPPAYYQHIKLKYKLPEKYILFLGNQDPKKNLGNTLKAYERVANQINIPFVIADIDQSFLAYIIENNHINPSIRQHIILPGYIDNADLSGVYGCSSLFLYTSFRESFGMPILEAMACGVPVITSNTSSMPEIAGEAALLVNPNNPNEIASSILDLLQNEDLKGKLIQAGGQRVIQFGWTKVAEKVLTIYHQVYKSECLIN